MVRVSRTIQSGSSPATQEDECRKYCERRGWPVVGVAVDKDVSGSTDPLERKGAGPWLREKLSEFDVVVAWKLNRIGRNAISIGELATLLQKRGKHIATADGQVDTTLPVRTALFSMFLSTSPKWISTTLKKTTNWRLIKPSARDDTRVAVFLPDTWLSNDRRVVGNLYPMRIA